MFKNNRDSLREVKENPSHNNVEDSLADHGSQVSGDTWNLNIHRDPVDPSVDRRGDPNDPHSSHSRVPLPTVGEHRSQPGNTLVDILEHAADEARNDRHAHADRARKGGSTIVK